MPSAWAPTARRVASKVAMAGCLAPVFCWSRALASFSSSLALPPSSSEEGTRTSSRTTSAVCADAVLLVLLALREALGLHLGRDDEAGLAPAAQRGVDGGHDHVDVGDAAVGGPRLGAVEDPLVLGLVVGGPGLQRRHVGAGVGLGHAERAQLHLLGRAEALRYPLHDLLGGAGAGDAGRRQARAEDGEADAGVAPEQLFEGDRERQAVSSPSEAWAKIGSRSSPPPRRAARGTPRARPTPPQPAARPTRRSRGPTS